MNKFYTVDRAGILSSGKIIKLEKFNDVKPDFLQDHVDMLFPNGVSSHGETYFLKNESRGNVTNSSIELLFEFVRRANFPELSSRFESFFACESLDDAKIFRSRFGSTTDKIFEIYSEKPYFKANMSLLNNDQTSLFCSYFADEYWKGNQGPTKECFWEVLLTLPIEVGSLVD